MMRIAVFALACLMSTSIASAQKRDARFGVFDAVLDSLYHNLGDRPPIVVVLDSLTEREGGIAYKGDLSIPHHVRIDPETIADFERATNRGSSFPSRYRYRTPFHRLNQVEFQQLWTRGNSLQSAIPNAQRTIDPYWLAFIEKYPTAWGVTILSDVGFNRDSSGWEGVTGLRLGLTEITSLDVYAGYLSQSYDQIIIDTPPVLGLADAPRFASVVDATMFIIEANRSQRGSIEAALRRLASARAHIIGAVLVKFNASAADPSYSYLADYYGYSAEDDAPTAGLIASSNVS